MSNIEGNYKKTKFNILLINVVGQKQLHKKNLAQNNMLPMCDLQYTYHVISHMDDIHETTWNSYRLHFEILYILFSISLNDPWIFPCFSSQKNNIIENWLDDVMLYLNSSPSHT